MVDLISLLNEIDPAALGYQDWVSVGMALKYEGHDVSVWDTWSSRDPARYHPGDCDKKWRSFGGGGAAPVTGGTIVQIAQENGWTPPHIESRALDWNDEISYERDSVIDPNWIEEQEVRHPASEWNPVQDLITYLTTLFDSTDYVGFNTKSFQADDGRYTPNSKGVFTKTAGEIIQELQACKGDMGAAIGDYDPAAGAWIRFNPLDGKGVKNDNVTDFRFALVESDDMEIDRQNAILRELELPIACLVHSGKKSLHAIVRVDAASKEEYRKRVDYLYSVCQKNSLQVDPQNRNPSRLSRMPGIMRGEQKQFLVDTNIGKASWNEWVEWIESVNDDLPEPEDLADVWDSLPDLASALIEGVLRQGHKMLLAGPSKAGKSYLEIELAIAVAEGVNWLRWSCAQGRVLYVNLELDRASCLHRFKDVYAAMGLPPKNLHNISIWNLRGKSIPMDQLAPKLIRRAAKKKYLAIIIDPIYKVITGDENSADQMARFCNQFDKVCNELGCAVIYCHHHSKGAQGGKRSMDRASGSGVFARDPDALLDMIGLELTDDILKQEQNKAACAAAVGFLRGRVAGFEDEVSQDDQCSEKAIQEAARRLLDDTAHMECTRAMQAATEAAKHKTAWRIEGTLREFAGFDPINCWFEYPIHKLDDSGALGDIDADGSAPPWQKATDKRKKQAK
ncbi:MAG: AAA family ATPase, partial [Firmicutes bacterium]|nr:AAA family ATPase [Bacillota bacterium]